MKYKNHIVMLDSKIGKMINFTSADFFGKFKQPVKTRGGRLVTPASQLNTGSKLWLDEKNNRMILVSVQEKDPNQYSVMDLMVMIAEVLKLDCCMMFPVDGKVLGPDIRPPYEWTQTEEEYDNRKAYVFTMKAEDILNKLRPVCIEKYRFNQSEIIRLVQLENPKLKEMEIIINAASKMVDQKAKTVTLYPDKILSNKHRFNCAQVLLYSYFFQDDITKVPPVAFEGDAIIKVQPQLKGPGKEQFVLQFDGEKWNPRPMPGSEVKQLEPVVVEQPDVKESH